MKSFLFISILISSLVSVSCSNRFAHIREETTYAEFELQDVNRSYLVHVPKGYNSEKSYPLIMVLHGIFSTAEAVANFSEFNRVADEKQFIVCYPQGYKKSWSIGINVGPAPKAGIDDLQFFDTLLNRMHRTYSIDTAKVYFTGISNGGFMASNLSSHRSEKFSGMALICSNMFAPIKDYTSDVKPMKVLLMGGTKDRMLKYEGEKFRRKYAFLGFPKTVDYWTTRNGLTPFSDSLVIDNDPKDKTRVFHFFNSTDTDDTKLELYKIEGAGHGWPGRQKDFKRIFLGRISKEITPAEIIADFFLGK